MDLKEQHKTTERSDQSIDTFNTAYIHTHKHTHPHTREHTHTHTGIESLTYTFNMLVKVRSDINKLA